MNYRLLTLAIILLLSESYVLYKDINATHIEQGTNSSDASVAKVKEVINDVQTRQAQSLIWDQAKSGESLQYYDSILTMKNGRSKVEFMDGTTLEVGPESLVVLEPPLKKLSGMRLNLKQGSATLNLKKGEKIETKKQLIFAKEDATIQLFSDAEGIVDTIVVEQPPVQAAVQTLSAENQEKNISLEPANAEKKPPVLSPVEITSILEAPKQPTGATSEPSVLPQREPAAEVQKPLGVPKIKIKHQNFEIEGLSGNPNMRSFFLTQLIKFFMSEAYAEVAALKTIPHLEWETVPEATSYEVQVSSDPEFKNVILTNITKNNFAQINLKQAGAYYWHVRVVDRFGHVGDFSDSASFSISIAKKEKASSRILAQSPPMSPQHQPSQTDKKETISTYKETDAQNDEGKSNEEKTVIPSSQASGIEEKEELSPKPIIELAPAHKSSESRLFALEARGLGNWGSMADSKGSFPSRPMLTGTGSLAAGVRIGRFTPSLCGEYFFSNQMTQPSSVFLNQNASGSGYLLGFDLKYKFDQFSVAGSYFFSGQYTLSQQTTHSFNSSYDKPTGLALTFFWPMSNRLSFLVNGKYISYSDWNLGGNISGDQVNQIMYGVGLSYELF